MARRDVDDPARSARPTINLTPMIDVTFQLIVVFLCALKFRTLDEKVEARLPDRGPSSIGAPREVVTKVSVRLRRRQDQVATTVSLLDARLGPADSPDVWSSLARRLRTFHERDATMKGEIDADPDVPHAEVVAALDAFLAADLKDVEFRATSPLRRR